MKVIELLASQLDREAMEHEIQAPSNFFVQSLDFWNLCLEARRLLLDEQLAKDEKNAPNIIKKE